MTEAEEQAYMRGSRAVWQRLLGECLRSLGEDAGDKHGRVTERVAAIAALRSLCAEFGDNEWDEDLHLADIIDKHLGLYLLAPEAEVKAEGDVGQTIALAVDILSQSRHAFRSRQIQQVREMLETLL